MTASQLLSYPVPCLLGTIQVPGDKSISHRALIFGAIAQGSTHVGGFLEGEDCLSTLKAFQSMGVVIERPSPQEVIIHGVGKYGLKQPKGPIDCGNSGTTMRLLAGLLCAQKFNSCLVGDGSLSKRPMLRVSNPLTDMGACIHTSEGKPPLVIEGGQNLSGIHYLMPVVSAQVKSCLLLAAMYAKGQTQVTETGISRDHTERMLKTFSYPLLKEGNQLCIDASSECKATAIKVPGDFSSAAFFLVAATLVPNADVLIKNVGINPTRTGLLDILKQMGAKITVLNHRHYGEEPVADIHVAYADLQGIEIPEEYVSLAIDEFPVLFIAAACAQGQTRLRGAAELRVKESDRIGVMAEGLRQLGIEVETYEDGIRIVGGKLQGGIIDSHGDHRIGMAFVIAGALASDPITIKNTAAVATSFPTFVATANSLGFRVC